MDPPLAVVTGGRGGLAAALAREFSSAGYAVHAPGREELDVRDAASVNAYFECLRRVDVLVNNAGITGDAAFARLAESDWDEVVDTNLKGAFLCSRAAAARMAGTDGQGGCIVQIGSYSALRPPAGQTAYAAAKAGLIGLTKSLAREFGPSDIRVNCVLPGFLETRMTAALPEPVRAAAMRRHVLGRFNTPEESALFVRHLCSLRHVSGQVFQLDSRP